MRWRKTFASTVALLAASIVASTVPTASAAAFTGFGDDEAGFYKTYAKAFREVWESERDWGEASSAEGGWGRGDAPEMGRSTDAYEVAEAFYSSWSEFVSRLSFGWVDDYNINEVRKIFEYWRTGNYSMPVDLGHTRSTEQHQPPPLFSLVS